jgi:hypothetical protein
MNANQNMNRNIYGNNVENWPGRGGGRTLSASSSISMSMSRPSYGDIVVRNRKEAQTKSALRELGRMVRGF